MALKSWLASLKVDVTAVTPVQAPIYEGLRCNGIEAANVADVTFLGGSAAVETSVTVAGNQTLHPEFPWVLGCTLVTSVTAEKINADIQITEVEAAPDQAEPKRLFRQRGPWLTDTAQSAAQAYHAHHFNCHSCIAAGRGTQYGRRCAVGLALWVTFIGADDLQTEGSDHGQA